MTTIIVVHSHGKMVQLSQIESALEECIATGTYLDASTILPSIMSEEDIADIIAVVLKPSKQKSTQLFGTTSKSGGKVMHQTNIHELFRFSVFTTQFIEKLLEPCQEIAAQNAKEIVENGSYQKFLTDSHANVGKGHDLDVESTKVIGDARSFLFQNYKKTFFVLLTRQTEKTNEDVKQLVEKVAVVHRDVKRKLNQQRNMREVVVIKDVNPIRTMIRSATRKRMFRRLS